MVNPSQQKRRASKRQAFLRFLLCAPSDKSETSAFRDEAPAQHVPVHAAASFLKTTTPLRFLSDHDETHYSHFSSMTRETASVSTHAVPSFLKPAESPKDQDEAQSFDSTKNYYDMPHECLSEKAYLKLQKTTSPAQVPNNKSKAAESVVRVLDKPSPIWAFPNSFDTPFPSVVGKPTTTKDWGVGKKQITPRDSLVRNRSKFGIFETSAHPHTRTPPNINNNQYLLAFDLLLPSHTGRNTVYSRLYDTCETAFAALRTDALNDDYALSIKRSKYHSVTQLKNRVILVCDRSDTYKPKDGKHERDVTSIKCGCPHRLNLQHLKALNKWQITVVDKIHNHEGTRSSSHVAHRQNEMDEEFIEYVDHATGSGETEGQIRRELNDANVLTGAKPSDIWINWRKDHPDTSIQQKDIYNAKTKIRQRRLGPYTPTQALLKALHRDNWFVKILLDEASKRVRRLVFVNKLAKEILGKNSVVIVMHCTYKTNKYVMPMLVIMGHTSLYSSFYIGFAFIETEGEEDFVWILEQLTALFKALGLNEPWVIVTDKDLALMNAIKIVYPRINHLLCLCHINKNILKNCKPSFETQEQWQEFLAAWYRVVYAPTKDECEEAWKNLAEEYEEDYSDECDYIHETWLVRWARRFCKAYTNKVTHFGTCTTSRVEGGPCVLKAKLKCSTGDLIAVVEGLEALLSNQHESYLHNLDVAKMKTPVNLPRDLMRDLLGRVTPYALGKIRKQYKHLRKAERKPDKYPLKPCTDVFFTTMGLPCAHRIKERIEAVEGGAGKLILELDVHPHWRFAKPEETFCTSTEFESDLPTTQTPFYVPPTEALETDDFDPFESPEVESLLRRSSSRIESPPRTEAELEVDDVLDVQEPNKVKKKGRPKGSANKKDVMTRAEEMAVKSTKHDPSGFEIVEQALEQRRKRAKTDTEANNSTGRGGRGGRRGRERGRGGRGGATSIRKKALREEHIEVSSDSESEDSESDDGFNDLDSDEEFTDSEAEGEDELNMR